MPPAPDDERLGFFLTTIRSLHGVDAVDVAAGDVSRFVNDPEVQLLRACKLEDGTVTFTATADGAVAGCVSEVLFVKRSPVALSPDTMASEVLVSTTTGQNAEVESLHALLSSFYCPRLLSGGAQLPPKVQALLQDLRAATGTMVRDGGEGPEALQSFRGIVSPLDEVQFWAEYRGRGIDYDLVKALNGAFDRDRGLWRGELEALAAGEDVCDWDRAGDFLDSTVDVLEAAWAAAGRGGAVYPQERMAHLLDCLAGSVAQAVTRHLRHAIGGGSLWKGGFAPLRATLRSAAGLCGRWLSTVSVAQTTLWPRGSARPWQGAAAYADSVVGPLQARLAEVLGMRATVEELRRLLSDREKQDHGLGPGGSAFRAVESLDPLLVNGYTQRRWDKAVLAWRASLAGAEAAVAAQFRRRVAPLHARPDLLLREFQRFATVLQRPAVAAELASERENLLGVLVEQLDAVESALDAQLAEQTSPSEQPPNGFGCGLSRAVSGIVLCRQTYARTAAQMAACKPLFGDLRACGEFEAMGEALLRKAKQQEQELLSDWSEEKLSELREDGDASLRMRGQLMDIPTRGALAGQLVVQYDEKLVVLLREVRQLQELALAVPKEIHDAAAQAEKFYRYGVMLKKVATYWNGLGDAIVPSQRPLLLNALKAFEKLVRSRTSEAGVAITWTTPGECAQYVDRLQAAADKLQSENASLRRSHLAVAGHVAGVMEVDLLRSKEAWKGRWAEAASVAEGLRRRYPEEHMRRWLLHWDENMYKALEASYQMGLESLNENLSEIRTDVVCVHGQALQFKPGLEELRSVYYREMKKFVSIPANFPGFGPNAHVYARMGTGNQAALKAVYGKAEDLFAKLSALLAEHRPWTVLGAVDDLDGFVEAHVTTPAQYDANFKMVKAKRKEAEKLPDVVKVDCVKVSLAPLKAWVDEALTKVSDALLGALRRRVLDAAKEVDAFLNDAMEQLSSRPRSIDEITRAQAAWEEMGRAQGEKKALSASCLEQKRALLQHAPGSDLDVGEVVSRTVNLDGEGGRWDSFEIAMEAFNDMIGEQKEALRSVLAAEVGDLNAAVARFSDKWRALKPGGSLNLGDAKVVAGVFDDLAGWGAQLAELAATSAGLVASCATFGMDAPSFDGLAAIEAEVEATAASWELLREFSAALEAVAEKTWIDFRGNVFELQDLAAHWGDRAKARVLLLGAGGAVTDFLAAQVESMKHAMPALKFCRGEPFGEEHWAELLQGKLKLGRDVKLANLKVRHFLQALPTLAEPSTVVYVKQLQARAQGEVTIREALSELRAWSQTAEVKLLEHEEAGRVTPIITGWKDLFLELGDKQSLLSSLKESNFFKAFADQGSVFDAKMSALDHHLHAINQIQRKWVYLEPIFERGALPSEAARFRRVDVEFRDTMGKLERDPKLFNLADAVLFHGLKESLETQLDQLERCQKALTEFLEEKRNAMPRFYFLGDDDLLEILGQAKNPTVIQSHLKKLFQGIHSVQFSEGSGAITAMVSSIGEVVTLDAPVAITDRVEEWLAALAAEMASTLKLLVAECLQVGSKLDAFPSQVLQVAENVKFVDAAEVAIVEGSLGQVKSDLALLLKQYTSVPDPSHLTSNKIKALILDLVHNMDVVDQLVAADARAATDWAWAKQLRLYAEPAGVKVKMVDAAFDYTYEYQGNAPKLVHTPLTDKCYLTLTQGMHMGFGGNPYGPAGTGKTESVKALGQAFGRQVLVFNCDEGIDFLSMGRIFIGLVKCGAWGCFDEFNRLKEDQLSAISQQIQVIQDAIKTKTSSLSLLGRVVDVNFNAGIFVTLNPAGKGYGGRSKLPDNLKALFRPVCLSVPDNEQIAEVVLYSEGYTTAKALSTKIVSLFTLSKQLLSTQQHYEWGLRALKAILNTAGKFLGQARAALEGESSTNDVATFEAETLIKAVRVNTLSKLTFGDTERFLDLIKDLFPGVASSDVTIPELEAAIRAVMASPAFGLKVDEAQVKKMLQMKESLDQRIGCVVVGPSGSGKTTVWQVLQQAMVACGQAVKTYVMNPKAMPRLQLLGFMDPDTREWTDGVLTDASRKVVLEPPHVRSWIVCDGDVDPEWIESLNSVLDDNHLLTLPNGERIAFGDNVNFLFETHDLRYASPATVSRMGMIFLSEDDVDVQRVTEKWTRAQPEADRAPLAALLGQFFFKALDAAMQLEFVVETTLVGTVSNGLSQLAGANTKPAFLVGLARGLGGNLMPAQRATFAKELFSWAPDVRPPNLAAPLDCYCDGDGRLLPFVASTAPAASQPATGETSRFESDQAVQLDSVIPTVAVQRTLAMMAAWVEKSEPFILVGPEGCGKDMIIRHAFKQRRGVSITTLNCNAQTTAGDVISKIAQTCSLFSAPEGRVYRPRDAERLVLYLKDLNLPKPDQYASCMLVDFLQQLITFRGFYDSTLEFLRVERVQIVCSMNPATTVGRWPLSTRFTAIARVGVLDYPEASELVAVYDTLLGAALAELQSNEKLDPKWCGPGDRDRDRAKLAATMVEVYSLVRAKFTVDDQRHYLFTPRDLTAWTVALLRYDTSDAAQGVELLDAVAHEACRLFRDRLVDSDAVGRFDALLASVFRSKWGHTLARLEGHFFTTLGQGKQAGGGGSARYLERLSEGDLLKVCAQGLAYFEREEADLGLLLFPQVLAHLTRVDRVLSTPGGHLLLAGRSGVGRRSAATLVAYMLGMQMVTPAVTRDFGVAALKTELKVAIQRAGIEGEPTLLYLEDHQLASDAILEVINSLLSSGEVPGLYTHEELEPLLAPLKEKAADAGVFRSAYDFFVHQVQQHLHVAVSMDPTNAKFLLRCESNPALYTRCALLWMGDWTPASMAQLPTMLPGVAELLRGEFEDEEDKALEKKGSGKGEGKGSKGERKGGGERKAVERKDNAEGALGKPAGESRESSELLSLVLSMHHSVAGATPLEYVTFLRGWKALHDSKRGGMSREIRKLKSGLFKLKAAQATVDELSANASVSAKELAEAQVRADAAMEQITKTLSDASGRRAEVKELQVEVSEKDQKTRERQEEIKGQLSSIQPILDSAKAAVGGIKSEHLNEITALKMPPDAIADVLGAVLKLLGVNDVSWLSMKKFLRSRGVKEDILNFDASGIKPSVRDDVAKLIQAKAASFDHAAITRVSVAAAPLAAWVKANVKYSLVLEKIQPLSDELRRAERDLDVCTSRLTSCNVEIAEIDEKVGRLKTEFASRTREAESLRSGLEKVTATLAKAEGLLSKLGGEQARWTAEAERLGAQLSTLPRLMLLAAAFTTYLGKRAEDVRVATLAAWAAEAQIPAFSYTRLLSTESQLLQWKSEGLPADSLSQENALVIAHSVGQRVPFVVDPADAATPWLKAFLAQDPNRPLEAVASFDPRFASRVELAVRFGKTLLLLDMDGVDPFLYPLARRDLTKQGSRSVVVVGDKVMDWHDNFRLCLVTRNPSAALAPDAAALVVEVNFSVTRSGLEGQLLGVTIQHEQPALEAQKTEMLAQEEAFKVQLAELESSLLAALAEAEGDLLENTSLIESLTNTKVLAAQISESLSLSAAASVELDEKRNQYRGFAKDGSQLFFLVAELTHINPMYRFSLHSFTGLFEHVLSDATLEAPSVAERLRLLAPALEAAVLFFVGRGLFKADRLMWALHLARGMRPGAFAANEWEGLTNQLVGDGGFRGPVPGWVAADRAGAYRALCGHFPKLAHALELENGAKWQRFAAAPECEAPSAFPAKCTPGQRLLVVQALRPDRLLSAMQQFALDALRLPSLSPPAQSFAQLVAATAPAQPILLITTPGSDPSKDLLDFAADAVGREKYRDLAMGGGQQQAATELLAAAARDGDWLCLKNLHLVVAWLPTLEKTLASLAPSMHPNFRLWLTTEPHPLFPPILLQSSLKVTFEAPPGIKKNLQRTLTSWGKDFLDGGGGASGASSPGRSAPSRDLPRARSPLLFLLAWFHAVVQERRTYLPQGWSKAYEFSVGDLRAGAMVLDAASQRAGPLDFKLIHGLMEDAIYGGRVDNPSDLKVLRTYVAQLYTKEMVGGHGGELCARVRMPTAFAYADLLQWAHELPDEDSPTLFGLPENIQRALQRSLSAAVGSQLRSLSVSGAAGVKFDRERWRASLSPLLEVWAALMEGQALATRARPKGEKGMSPTDQFVVFEHEAAAQLCVFVDSQVAALKAVVFGTALLTPSLQAVGAALLQGEVPAAWEKKWEGPPAAAAWLETLGRKKRALSRWADAVAAGRLLAAPLNLADLFNPGTFLNALRQEAARRLKVPLEETKLVSAWGQLQGCDLTLTLDGLWVENATVGGNNNELAAVAAQAPEMTRAPTLCLAFVALAHPEPYRSSQDTLAVPVYLAPSREQHLVDFVVPVRGDPSTWVLAGVAFLLSEK